jgi:hypothetical protein
MFLLAAYIKMSKIPTPTHSLLLTSPLVTFSNPTSGAIVVVVVLAIIDTLTLYY